MTQISGAARPGLPNAIPPSTVRLEIEGDIREGKLSIVAYPSGRNVVTMHDDRVVFTHLDERQRREAEEALVVRAAGALAHYKRLLDRYRLYMTRPHGTCSACASALEVRHDIEHWCDMCQRFMTPAGARNG